MPFIIVVLIVVLLDIAFIRSIDTRRMMEEDPDPDHFEEDWTPAEVRQKDALQEKNKHDQKKTNVPSFSFLPEDSKDKRLSTKKTTSQKENLFNKWLRKAKEEEPHDHPEHQDEGAMISQRRRLFSRRRDDEEEDQDGEEEPISVKVKNSADNKDVQTSPVLKLTQESQTEKASLVHQFIPDNAVSLVPIEEVTKQSVSTQTDEIIEERVYFPKVLTGRKSSEESQKQKPSFHLSKVLSSESKGEELEGESYIESSSSHIPSEKHNPSSMPFHKKIADIESIISEDISEEEEASPYKVPHKSIRQEEITPQPPEDLQYFPLKSIYKFKGSSSYEKIMGGEEKLVSIGELSFSIVGLVKSAAQKEEDLDKNSWVLVEKEHILQGSSNRHKSKENESDFEMIE